MTKHRSILNFIEVIRDSFPDVVKVYTCGSCFQFYRILKKVYPEAECYYNVTHVITKIDNFFYDVEGTVLNTKNYIPLKEYNFRMIKSQTKHRYVNRPGNT